MLTFSNVKVLTPTFLVFLSHSHTSHIPTFLILQYFVVCSLGAMVLNGTTNGNSNSSSCCCRNGPQDCTCRVKDNCHFHHPLDPLSAQEIALVAQTIRDHLPPTPAIRFVTISLHEPTLYKDQEDFEGSTTTPPPPPPMRQAEVVLLHPETGLATEYVLNLIPMQRDTEDNSSSSSIVAEITNEHTLPAGTQPMLTPEDCDLAESIAKTSIEVQIALKERYGITDMDRVVGDPWSVNLVSPTDYAMTSWRKDNVPGRLVQTFLYYRQNGNDMECNHYCHPIDILPVVDLNAQTVVRIDGMDRVPAPTIPTASVHYHRNLLNTNTYLESVWRSDTAKALNVLQPNGPSFVVCGNLVEWQKWSFRIGFNYREGFVLHNVTFDGRSVAKRMSLVEMAVPYADPHPPFQRKCAFDVGDYGLGYCANSLELGCDCLGHIHYFDTVLSNAAGEPVLKKKVICMHEEDNGILWKHVEYRNGHNESRRSRELVISSIATVVNYEYLFYWRLKQDGMIDFEIKLSGELSTNLPAVDEMESGPNYGVIVAPGVNSQIHQHLFCMRLHMAVDGEENMVSEVDVVPLPMDPTTNPYGNVFIGQETVLTSELKAIRRADETKARTWKISHANKKNRINGKSIAYKLVPFTKGMSMPVNLCHPDSVVGKKGKFASAHLWVTPYMPEERFPAGEYTPQGDGSMGVQDWTQQDRDIVGKSIVLWHAFGVTHVPRIEDFPVMPVEVTGFSLKQDNFMLGNPTIDMPPEHNETSQLAANGDRCCGLKKSTQSTTN